MNFGKILEKRHCARKFKATKAVSWKDAAEILDAAKFAPCAGGIFTVRLIIIDDKKKKEKIADACLGQAFIADAPYIIVVCSDMEMLKKSYGKFAETYAKQQAGAAIENMFLKATEMGIATCWIGAFDENPIRRLTGVPDTVNIEAVLPLGYELGKTEQKPKIELKHLVYFNDWKTKYTAGWESRATSNE